MSGYDCRNKCTFSLLCCSTETEGNTTYFQATGEGTDLHIYNLDAIPPIQVVSNHVDTDKLTTAHGGTFTSSSPITVANHVKARQSPIESAVT